MGAAFLALILTAGVSLTLPLAVRRVVDNFGIPDDSTLDKYFAAALGIAALWRWEPRCAIPWSRASASGLWRISGGQSLIG